MIELSSLSKTWILDVDGTLVKHNGYLSGKDVLLDGVKEFFEKIDKKDKVILLTARKREQKKRLEEFLAANHIRYDMIIYDIPLGERILVNDKKPSGLKTSYAINKERDGVFRIDYCINEKI